MSIRASTCGLRTRQLVLAAGGSAVLWLAASLQARPAYAYRPFDGTDGDVADVGEFELELGPLDFQRENDQTVLSTPTVLNMGVIPRMELVLDFVPVYPENGQPTSVVDTDFFAKFLLRSGALQGEAGPSIALEMGPLLPEVRGASGFGASANLIVSERWGWLTLHLDNEAELSRGDLDLGWMTSLIGEADLHASLRPVAELGWEIDVNSGSAVYSALGGVIWEASEGLDLDVAGRVASDDGERAFEARFGLTWAVRVWGSEAEAKGTAATQVGALQPRGLPTRQ